MRPGQPATDTKVGQELLARGCSQGALLEAPARMLWLREPGDPKDRNGPWAIAEDNLEDALLVVVSQDCDICAAAKTEPRVETITARWTSNASEIHAARKGNSARLYFLKESGGKALLADSRRRVHIDKQALRSATFSNVLPDERARSRFARWVAGRYDRPAIANELVDAIHKPLVKALDALARNQGELLGVVDRIAELRFVVSGTRRPLTVDFIAMLDEPDELTPEEEADFGAWLEDMLVAEGGPIQEIRLVFRNPRSISLHDYLQTARLQLDQYSPEAGPDTVAS